MDRLKTRQEIGGIIARIKRKPFTLDEGDYDAHLTGSRFAMSSLDMVYLYLEVKKRYHVRFEADDFTGFGFNTINRITEKIVSDAS